LAKKFYPNVNDGDKFFEEKFQEVQIAYEIFSDSNEEIIMMKI
jgi:DnaJ-class molecular chaperone